MRKAMFVLLVLAVLMATALPVSASLSIQGIYYNFGAPENQPALTVRWTGRPAFEVRANEFYLQKVQGQWETITGVESRIQEKFNDLLVEDIKLSTLEADSRVRQDPPILLWPSEEIIVILNSDYLRIHKAFFAIHIYSLDDLETPESELNFLTRFSNFPIPPNWW